MDGWARVSGRRIVAVGFGLVLGVGLDLVASEGRAQDASRNAVPTATGQAPGTTTSQSVAPSENLTVLGRRHHYEAAPVPGGALPPPPDKPGMHLGRYKISGDQTRKDGYDAQTGAYIAPFGSAYTGASPVANGLASQHGP